MGFQRFVSKFPGQIPLLLLLFGPPAFAGIGSFDVIAFDEQPAPGQPAGVVFGDFGIPVVNAQRHIAFRARLQNPFLVESVWVSDPDSALQAIPVAGGQALCDSIGQLTFNSSLSLRAPRRDRHD